MSHQNQEKNHWLALIGISIAGFLGCLDLTIVNTALPAIQTDLGLSVTQLQWVMTILLLALTSCMVIAGKLGDLYGRPALFLRWHDSVCTFFFGSGFFSWNLFYHYFSIYSGSLNCFFIHCADCDYSKYISRTSSWPGNGFVDGCQWFGFGSWASNRRLDSQYLRLALDLFH